MAAGLSATTRFAGGGDLPTETTEQDELRCSICLTFVALRRVIAANARRLSRKMTSAAGWKRKSPLQSTVEEELKGSVSEKAGEYEDVAWYSAVETSEDESDQLDLCENLHITTATTIDEDNQQQQSHSTQSPQLYLDMAEEKKKLKFSFDRTTTVVNEHLDWGSRPQVDPLEWSLQCICQFPFHYSEFDPHWPLIVPPGVIPGTYEEMLIHAKSILGNWITVLDRSQSLDPQMQHIGIGRLKRSVMNRLAVPFAAVLEQDATILHCWIGTPLGNKHMHAHLLGEEILDQDREVGHWAGVAKMVDFKIPWFCGGRPVRALQLKRMNPVFGTAYETRVVLPDKELRRILLFNILICPLEPHKPPFSVDRILKYIGPIV